MTSDFLPIGLSQALDLMNGMRGQLAWGAAATGDNVLSFEIGDPILWISGIRGPDFIGCRRLDDGVNQRHVTPRGRWHLFVDDGMWSVDTHGYACSRTDAEGSSSIGQCLRHLSGQKIVEVLWEAEAGEWRVKFDLGGILRISAPPPHLTGDLSEEWVLLCPDACVLRCVEDTALFYADRSAMVGTRIRQDVAQAGR